MDTRPIRKGSAEEQPPKSPCHFYQAGVCEDIHMGWQKGPAAYGREGKARMNRSAAKRQICGMALLFAAVLGCSYNPGYFPHILPGGPIVQHHAKPAGWGYFHNFDPKAYKVEIIPNDQVQAPLGAAIVLVGTVFDKDGQPRRSRRIEWLLEGVGTIVEADESGIYPGRGYKVDSRYAVTYTNYRSHTLTRGNDDPSDDVVLAPGQTYCVVSSSIPGETVVTAYAPEVFSWANSRAVVRIYWGEGRFQFPAPAVVRSGGEWTLTTRILPESEVGRNGDYRVRYRVLDGPPVELVTRNGSGTTASRTGSTSREAEVFTDAEGQATVRLIQLQPQPGKSRIAIEIVRLAEHGPGTGTVVARRETTVEWAVPELGLTVQVPSTAGVQAPFAATVVLDNASAVDSQNPTVQVRLSSELSLLRSEPPPQRMEPDGSLVFTWDKVPGRGRQQLQLQLRGKQSGTARLEVFARSSEGLEASQRKNIVLEPGRLHAVVEAPSLALPGERIPIRIAVTNAGSTPVENATAWLHYDSGLTHPTPDRPLEIPVGHLDPGQTRTLDISLLAQQRGQWQIRMTVTADGQLSCSASPVTIEVRKAELVVGIHGPPLVYLHQEGVATITISNRGEVAIDRASLRLVIPPELQVTTVENGGRRGAAGVEWNLPPLSPSEQKTVSLRLRGTRLSDRAVLSAIVLAEVSPGQRSAEPLQVRSEATMAVIGVPVVSLELMAPTGVFSVGQRLSYQVRVRNNGSLTARDLIVRMHMSEHLRFLTGRGPQPQITATLDGDGQILFTPLAELKPGESALYRLDVQASRAGEARIRAQVHAQHLQRPLIEEQTATIAPR